MRGADAQSRFSPANGWMLIGGQPPQTPVPPGMLTISAWPSPSVSTIIGVVTFAETALLCTLVFTVPVRPSKITSR